MRNIAVASFLLLAVSIVQADVSGVADLQSRWAQAMYVQKGDAKTASFEQLAESARALARSNADDPAALIWQGIVLSTFAGEKGGLGALGLVKEARASLEAALKLDPTALDGSAYTSLGSLYYKVPGWPIGFGSDKKARKHLEKALELNPNGIDANFFMGEFLLEQGEEQQARTYLQKALAAPDRPSRPIADAGRREEIQALLARLEDD